MGKVPSLTIQKKSEIVAELEQGVSPKILASKYRVTQGCVSKIKKNAKTIISMAQDEIKLGWISRKNVKNSQFKKVHVGLYIWIVQERYRMKMLNDTLLLTMASKFKKSFYNDSSPMSIGFLQNFKKSKRLRKVKATGEKRAADKDAILPFKDYFRKLIVDGDFSLAQIYNADESALYWKNLPESSIILPQESSDDVEGNLIFFTYCCLVLR